MGRAVVRRDRSLEATTRRLTATPAAEVTTGARASLREPRRGACRTAKISPSAPVPPIGDDVIPNNQPRVPEKTPRAPELGNWEAVTLRVRGLVKKHLRPVLSKRGRYFLNFSSRAPRIDHTGGHFCCARFLCAGDYFLDPPVHIFGRDGLSRIEFRHALGIFGKLCTLVFQILAQRTKHRLSGRKRGPSMSAPFAEASR